MLKHLFEGTSWIALRAPDDETGTAESLGDAHGDEVLESGPEDPPASEVKESELPLEPKPEPVAESPPPAPEPKKTDWKDKEMARRARRLDEERSRAEAAEARAKAAEELAESLSRQGQQDSGDENQPRPAPRQPQGKVWTEEDVKAEARRLTAESEFKRDFDGAYNAGSSKFGKGKMDEAIARISELGGLDYDHLQMVLATDEPGKVLHDLGSKPEEFQRIMELPFNRRVAEFVKMGLKTEARQPLASKAPAPVEPIGGSGGSVDNRYDDRSSDGDWFREEEKRAAAAWKKKQEGWR